MAVRLETVHRLALELPGAVEGTSYGSLAFRVRGKLFARMHRNGDSLVVKVDFDDHDTLLAAKPGIYHITDHYRPYSLVLVRLAQVEVDALRERLEQAWRACSPRQLVQSFLKHRGN